MGVKANLDILTMSLGGSDGWTEGTGSVVSSRIAASGKIVTIAAGNEVCFSFAIPHSRAIDRCL
jgi:hypothetical protein